MKNRDREEDQESVSWDKAIELGYELDNSGLTQKEATESNECVDENGIAQ